MRDLLESLLADGGDIMGYCGQHKVWEGWSSKGLVRVQDTEFVRALSALFVVTIDDTTAPVTDAELHTVARRLSRFYHAESWLTAPAQFGATVTSVEELEREYEQEQHTRPERI